MIALCSGTVGVFDGGGASVVGGLLDEALLEDCADGSEDGRAPAACCLPRTWVEQPAAVTTANTATAATPVLRIVLHIRDIMD
jgi:hypothetical protein